MVKQNKALVITPELKEALSVKKFIRIHVCERLTNPNGWFLVSVKDNNCPFCGEKLKC